MEVEMIAPLSLEKPALSEVEECVTNNDIVSTEQLQDFLHNVKSPCEIAPTKSSEEPKGSEELEDKETIHKMEGFFQDKGHDCQQLTKNHFGINRSPLIVCTSEKLQSASESKCNK